MPADTHPIDVPPSRPLIAAFFLIVGLGLLGLGVRFHPHTASMQGTATDTIVTEFDDPDTTLTQAEVELLK
jgi:hypothetical protein